MHQSNFMAYRIRDIYSFEQFPSMAEFLDNLEKNQWKRHSPKKKVSAKGKRSLTIDYKNKSIFVKLDFSKILNHITPCSDVIIDNEAICTLIFLNSLLFRIWGKK